MIVNAFERWGGWLINLGGIVKITIDGQDVLLRGQRITEVRLPGIAAKFSARYASGTGVAISSLLVWFSPTECIGINQWIACDTATGTIYDLECVSKALSPNELAAAQAMLASLPDQLTA